MPSAWIRGSLLWPRTSAKIFSIPAICCLAMMCQPASPKGRRRISNSPHPLVSPDGRRGESGRGGDMEPTREIYGNIVAGELVYLFMVVSFGLVGLALYRHYRLWMQGRPANRLQGLGQRLKVMLVQ